MNAKDGAGTPAGMGAIRKERKCVEIEYVLHSQVGKLLEHQIWLSINGYFAAWEIHLGSGNKSRAQEINMRNYQHIRNV